MSGNGKKVDMNQIETLTTYKNKKLSSLLTVVNEQKTIANDLLVELKEKKTVLHAEKESENTKVAEPKTVEPKVEATKVEPVKEETKVVEDKKDIPVEKTEKIEKKAKTAKKVVADSNIKKDEKVVSEKTEKIKKDEPAKKVESKPKAETVKPKTESTKAEKSSAPKSEKTTKTSQKTNTQKPAKDASKSSKPEIIRKIGNMAEVKDENGEIRRIYIPPEKKTEKKPAPKNGNGVQTRVFTNGNYQNRNNRYQNNNNNGGGRYNNNNNNNGRFNNNRQNPGAKFRPTQFSPNNAPVFPQKSNQSTQKKKTGNRKEDKKSMNKRQLMKRGYIVDTSREVESYDYDGRIKMKKQKKGGGYEMVDVRIENAIITTPMVTIKTLAEKIGKPGTEIIKQLFILDIIKTINDSVDFDTAKLVAGELGIDLQYKPDKTFEDTLNEQDLTDDVDDIENMVTRPPVITIMGHVDHGKTSLLDHIRNSHITSSEAGGITQHIGAYSIKVNGKSISFLDTPGHEAFTAMRARGAQVTDIAIIVVAADDGIMPQTIEAIDHAHSANVNIIVAVNKMDKPTANPDQVLQQLAQHNVLAEEWGGDVPVVQVSAKTGMGVDHLLETILLVAEMKELKANPSRAAKGTIIEARLDKGKGPIATILVEKGTLNIGDSVIAGVCVGKIRSMNNDKGMKVKSAGPSMPVAVTGFGDVPNAGDIITVVESDKFARQLAEERKLKLSQNGFETAHGLSLDDVFSNIKSGKIKELCLIIKADVQGSLEAVKQSLIKLSNEEVKIKVIHGGVGAVKESDVQLAKTTGAIIIGFNVRPDANAKVVASQQSIDIRTYSIIYDAIEDMQKAITGMLDPKFEEVGLGKAEVRELFKVSSIGTIAGSHVTEGKILRNAKVRVNRNDDIVFEGSIASLKHEKDDVKEMAKNFDCGILLDGFNDIKIGDIIEAYTMEQVKRWELKE